MPTTVWEMSRSARRMIGGGFDEPAQVITRDIENYQRLIDALPAERT
jgi:hypothetical protein